MDQAVNEQKLGNCKVASKLFKKVHAKSQIFKAEAFTRWVTCLRDSKQWDEAIHVLSSEIREIPFTGEYRVWLSEVYFSTENYQASLDEIQYAEKILGTEESILNVKSKAQQKLGKHEDAVLTLNQYIQKYPKSYSALATRSYSYAQLNQLDKAFADLYAAYVLRPFNEEIITSLTKVALSLESHGDVKTYGQKCIEQFPQNLSCLISLGKSAFETQDYLKAIKFLEAVLAIDSSDIQTRLLYAESLSMSGKNSEADLQYAQIFRQKPDYEPAMRSWSSFLRKRQDIEILGERLKEFNLRDPKSVWAAIELANLLRLVGKNDEALATVKKVINASRSDFARLHYAYLLSTVEKFGDAGDIIEDIEDKTLEKSFHLALTYFKRNKLSDATQYWHQVKPVSPLYFQSQVNIALIYEQQGQIEKTKEILSSLTVPTEYRSLVDKKILSLSSSEERKPATSQTASKNEISYFLEWKLPAL